MSSLWSAGLAAFIYFPCTKLHASSRQKQSEGRADDELADKFLVCVMTGWRLRVMDHITQLQP